MKLKKVKIIVEPLSKTNERWAKALRGKTRSNKNQEIISVDSWEVLGKLLSPPRLQILAAIAQEKPESIAALARILKKNFKNVHSDVMFLSGLGLIDLKEVGTRKRLVPIAKYSDIEFPFAA